MSLDETAFIRYQNSRKGSISAPLIQSRAVESMYYCYHHLQKGEGERKKLNAAIEWTKRNIRCCGDTSIAQVEGSGSCPDITKTLRRWFEHYEDYGECPIQTAKRYGGRKWKSKITDAVEHVINADVCDALINHLHTNPTLYLDEMQTYLKDDHEVVCSISLIKKALALRGITRKQIYSKASQVIEASQLAFICSMQQALKRPEQALFIDETHKDRDAHRRKYGWSGRGVKINWYETFNPLSELDYTMIGVADCFGFCDYMCECIDKKDLSPDEEEVDPPFHAPKGVNTVRFMRFMLERVIPHLGNYLRGEAHSVVIMDNCKIHLHPELERLINEAGAILIYSAPYACELIPIEVMFRSYKAFLKRHSKDFPHHLVHAAALRHLTPVEGLNIFRVTTLHHLVDNHPLMQKKTNTHLFACLAILAMDI